MDILEQVVRHHEEFMQAPYPRGYVMLLVADATENTGGGGPKGDFLDRWTLGPHVTQTSSPTKQHISTGPSPPSGSLKVRRRFMGVPHFVGQEGFLSGCTLADNLSGLDDYDREVVASGGDDGALYWSACAYSLGSGLFQDLYDALDAAAFRSAFTRLYLSFRDEIHVNSCFGAERGVCYVRAAFVDVAESEEAAATAERIIDHWYDGPGQTAAP